MSKLKSVKTLIKNVDVDPWHDIDNKVSVQVCKLISQNLEHELSELIYTYSRQVHWHVWDTVCPLEPEDQNVINLKHKISHEIAVCKANMFTMHYFIKEKSITDIGRFSFNSIVMEKIIAKIYGEINEIT